MRSDHNNNTLPPVFVAALCPDIFTRLDAKIAERTRIPNAGLYERMLVQERLLNNYKTYMMKRHEEEVEKIRLDQKRLMKCSPGLDPKTQRPMFKDRQIGKEKKANICHKDVKQCQRCYIHHTPYKDIYYQNWWLRNMAAQKEIIRLKFCQRYR